MSVHDDVIQDIFVYPQMLGGHLVQDSLQLHKSGHVFIAPEGLSQPFYLTVMTQKGKVQDLKVIPGAQSAAPIILTTAVPDQRVERAQQHQRKQQEAALVAALQGLTPPDFTKTAIEVTSEDQGKIGKRRVEAYLNQRYGIDVYVLENQSDREIFLTPELFLGASDLAVMFDAPSLPAGGHMRMAILRQRLPPQRAVLKPISLTQIHKG